MSDTSSDTGSDMGSEMYSCGEDDERRDDRGRVGDIGDAAFLRDLARAIRSSLGEEGHKRGVLARFQTLNKTLPTFLSPPIHRVVRINTL